MGHKHLLGPHCVGCTQPSQESQILGGVHRRLFGLALAIARALAPLLCGHIGEADLNVHSATSPGGLAARAARHFPAHYSV